MSRLQTKMKKSDLKNKICSNFPNHSPLDISLAVDLVSKYICDGLKKNERIEIRGFGSFSIRKRSPIRGRNPKTGEKVNTPEKKTIHFKMSKDLFKKLNNEE